MHSLKGIFINQMEVEIDNTTILKKNLYPIKMIIPPMKTRILYFRSEDLQLKWAAIMSEKTENKSLYDFYIMEEGVLG